MSPISVHDGLLQIFNVEHGACALLTLPTKRILIDCGHNASIPWYVGTHLRRMGVQEIERMIVTNLDEDHVSGFPNLLAEGITVNSLFSNDSVKPDDILHLKSETGVGNGIAALVSWLKTSVPLGLVQRAAMFPGVTFEYFRHNYPQFDDENNLSLVVNLTIHGYSFLFCGDMECQGFRLLLATNSRFRQVLPTVQVLMASHHGRDNGICKEMFDVYGCKPHLVVISDENKKYGSQETNGYYAEKCRGVVCSDGRLRKVLTTRKHGEINFSFRNGQCAFSWWGKGE